MAGYLGTLFMANVGMRLLLPPKSEYNKAASSFGMLVDKIQGKQKSYFNNASVNNVRSLQKTLNNSRQLVKDYSDKTGKDTLGNLKKNLTEIQSFTRNASGRFKSYTGYAGGAMKNLQQVSQTMPKLGTFKGSRASFAKAYANDIALLEVQVKKLAIAQEAAARNSAKAAQELQGMAATLIGTFRSALMTSITLLTTLGYTIRGLSQDYAVFERELINANSIWQEQNEVLYDISDRVIKFGEDYGVAYDNASRVLYQFASAGLEAAEAQAVLNDVLILTMAVQGDANTIGKLTVQTIKGFGLEMSDAGEVTDKFAHSINASLIEYQDLASAIKFALPFYAATNQDLDQLLGSIQVLSDRALEAGIAGRGLRQALAEFAEGAEDSTRKFAEMGVEVTDAQGNFLQLTEIARNFSDAVGTEIANDTELLTTLIEDLNIRGATAFIHLVQNVDEFEQAVAELANSQGAAAKMADVQQNSLAMMTQKMINATKEVFFLSEAQFVANGYMNELDYQLKNLVDDFTQLFLVEMPDGSKQLTQLSYDLRELVITSLQGFSNLMTTLIEQLVSMTQQGFSLADMARTLFIPLNLISNALSLTSNVLGTGLDANGLIFKFYGLSMVFGSTAAAALVLGDALAEVLDMAEGVGDVVGTILMVGGALYTGGGTMLATRGAAAAGGRTAGLTGAGNVFRGKGYAKKLDNFMTRKGYSDLAHPDFGKFKSVVRPTMSSKRSSAVALGRADELGSGDLYRYGLGTRQARLGETAQLTMGPDKYRTFYPTVAGENMRLDLLSFADDYARADGYTRMLRGAGAMYAGYGAVYGIPTSQNFASNAMAAQMNTSSVTTGGGQDLYIDNAYIESNNFKDLFYSADELGG